MNSFSINGKSCYMSEDGRHIYESLNGSDVGYVNNNGSIYTYQGEYVGRISSYGIQSMSGSTIGDKYGNWHGPGEQVLNTELDDVLIRPFELAGKIIVKGTWWLAGKIEDGIRKKLENYVNTNELKRETIIHSLSKKAKEEGKTGFIIKDEGFGFNVYLYNGKLLNGQLSKINVKNSGDKVIYKLDKDGNVINPRTDKTVYMLNKDGKVVDNNNKEVGVQIGNTPFVRESPNVKNKQETLSML